MRRSGHGPGPNARGPRGDGELRAVVAGLGAEDRGDDAAGLEAARLLSWFAPGGVRVHALAGGRTTDLLELWEGVPLAVVVDAAVSGAPPGTVHRLDGLAAPLPPSPDRSSTHGLSVADVIELGRALGRLPERLLVLGIEAGDVDPGRGLTPPVRAGVQRAVRAVLGEVGRAGRGVAGPGSSLSGIPPAAPSARCSPAEAVTLQPRRPDDIDHPGTGDPMSADTPIARPAGTLRPVSLELGAAPFAEGSCLIEAGRTRVLCAATVEEGVPAWREGRGGWVTGEYAMLPRSTSERSPRERRGAGGRTKEIQRLIGRSLRAAVDLEALGEHTVIVDCDVLVADGGTRTASITGGCLALWQALEGLVASGALEKSPLTTRVAAVSVGIVGGEPVLDLDYELDVAADVDMNVVALEDGRLVEVQGTAEGSPFGRDALDSLLDLALGGIDELLERQREMMGRT